MEKLTREEIEMCEIAVGIVIDRLDLTSENKAKWEALFDRLEVLQRETCLTPLAPDAATPTGNLAGMMHGEGLLGTESHQKMFDEGKELLTQIKVLLTQRAPDEANCPHCGEPLAAAALHEFCYPPAPPFCGLRKPLALMT